MEFAGPLRLDQAVLQQHPPTFERVMAIMREIAEAMDYAHAQGIVHGALRPRQVLLDGAGHVHLKGFVLRENELSPHPALEPDAVGDAAYMAPEQWRLKRVDRRVDVYSAGVLAYELCTGQGRVSYEMPGVPEIRPVELTPNRPLRDGVPLHASAAIRRATAKEAPVRFASVGEFVEALANPAVALGQGLPTFVSPVKRERASPFLLILLVALAGVVALLVPEASRERVVKVAKSVLSIEGPTIDPLDVRTRPSGGSSGGASGGGSTSAPSPGREPSTRRDTTTGGARAADAADKARSAAGISARHFDLRPR